MVDHSWSVRKVVGGDGLARYVGWCAGCGRATKRKLVEAEAAADALEHVRRKRLRAPASGDDDEGDEAANDEQEQGDEQLAMK